MRKHNFILGSEANLGFSVGVVSAQCSKNIGGDGPIKWLHL